MQTSFSFCDESYPRFSRVSIRNEAAINGSSAHFCLLRAFPTIRMAEDKLKVVLQGTPQSRAACVCIDNEVLCTLEEIAKVFSEDLHGGFSLWKGWKSHSVHFEFHGLRPQAKLESV
jgi:hypothetical protein